MQIRRTTLTAALLPIVTTMALVQQSAGADESAQTCPSATEVADGFVAVEEVPEGTDVVMCDLVGIRIEVPGSEPATSAETPAAVQIPSVGEGIEMAGYSPDGTSVEFSVVVENDGNLTYKEAGAGAGGGEDPCTDEANNQLGGGYLNNNETFNIKTTTIPGYLNEDKTRESIVSGIRAWPQLFNDCDLADNVDVTVVDGGGSTDGSSANASGCDSANNNSTSVFTFGSLPGNLVGLTCRHIIYTAAGNYSDGGDVRLHTYWAWTNEPDRADCQELDIQSIATHEAGHWWGAAHVDDANHPRLTMRDGGIEAVACRSALRTLGKGDVLSMRAIY